MKKQLIIVGSLAAEKVDELVREFKKYEFSVSKDQILLLDDLVDTREIATLRKQHEVLNVLMVDLREEKRHCLESAFCKHLAPSEEVVLVSLHTTGGRPLSKGSLAMHCTNFSGVSGAFKFPAAKLVLQHANASYAVSE